MVKCRWLQCAKKLLNWAPIKLSDSDDEISDTDERPVKGRWKLQKVMSVIEEGSSFMENNAQFQKIVNDLHLMMKLGYQNEFTVRFLFSI